MTGKSWRKRIDPHVPTVFHFFPVRRRRSHASTLSTRSAGPAAIARMMTGDSLLTEYAASRSESAQKTSVAAKTSALGRVLKPMQVVRPLTIIAAATLHAAQVGSPGT